MTSPPKLPSDKIACMVRREKWLWLHLASLLVVLIFLTYSARGQWFFGDEWDFLAFRGIRGTPKVGLWTPHNEHWSTLPILAWRAIFSFVGIKSYWPYLGLLFAGHLLCMHLLWQILRRTPRVPPGLAFGGVAVFGLYGPGWENLFWAFQIGFIGSVAAGLGLILAVDEAGSRRRVLGVALGAVLSLMISGISVVMVVVFGLVALLKWGWRKAVVATLPAGLIYIVWLQRYARPSLDQQNSLHGTLWDAPGYVVEGLAGTLGEAVGGHQYVGVGLLAALAAFVVWKLRWMLQAAPAAVAMGVGAVSLFAVISQGRGALVDPVTSRYLYISAAMLLPLVAMGLATLSGRWQWSRAVAVLATLAVVANGVVILRSRAEGERRIDLSMRGQLIAAMALADSGITILSDQPQSPFNPDVSLADLRSMRASGKLFPLVGATERDRAAAQIALQAVTLRGLPTDRPLGATTALDARGMTVEVRPDGCADINPRSRLLTLRVDAGNAFSLTADRAEVVDVYFGYDGGYGGPRRFFLRPNETQSFASDLVGNLAVELRTSTIRLCGIAWDSARLGPADP